MSVYAEKRTQSKFDQMLTPHKIDMTNKEI